ncbi:MAG: sulfite exporter TauE/SafE family protein [Gemmatimonadetes bacterium]|nr:sulfite exporter TauE/SafE family protein [Gemmatimonadota bacterium]
MPGIRTLLFVILGLLAVVFFTRWAAQVRSSRGGDEGTIRPSWVETAIGFVTNFFDTLGIGSFAPTTAVFKLRRVVPDERIPGTLHVGHTPPVIVQAFIFIAIVQVGVGTLASLIGASVLGAWLGAGAVARWPRRRIQLGMGIALLLAATSFVMSIYGLFPAGGVALSLEGGSFVFAMAGMFVLGALMTLGIGLYAPCMIMVSLLGMNPTVAFPIMMGASAFLMPVASVRFLAARRYSLGPAVGLAVGGLPAVLIAAFIVRSLPLNAMRWLVVVVVLYSAIVMLRSAYVEGTVRGGGAPAAAR